MHRLMFTIPVLALSAATAFAQAPAARTAAKPAAAKQAATAKKPLVEFEMMTWPEVKAALAAGKTTALVYTGGTEQRGPQNVNGGHTLMGREIVEGDRAQARQRDRDAGAAVHAEQRERGAARHDRPDAEILGADARARSSSRRSPPASRTSSSWATTAAASRRRLRRSREEAGREVRAGGQARLLLRRGLREGAGRLRRVARRARLSAQLARRHSRHLDDAVSGRRQGLGAQGTDRDRRRRSGAAARRARPGPRTRPDPNAPPRKNNGITGDARRSTVALGKQAFDIKIDYAVKQIQGFLANQTKTHAAVAWTGRIEAVWTAGSGRRSVCPCLPAHPASACVSDPRRLPDDRCRAARASRSRGTRRRRSMRRRCRSLRAGAISLPPVAARRRHRRRRARVSRPPGPAARASS